MMRSRGEGRRTQGDGEGQKEESCVLSARTEARAGAMQPVMGLLTQFASPGMKGIKMTSNQPNLTLLSL